MTRDELLAKLTRQRASKIILTWGQFASAIGNLTAGQKTTFLTLLDKDLNKAAAFLGDVSKKARFDLAKAEVDAIAADDTYTTTDLLSLLG